jgi:cytosine/adenosine deaminase-related metal-dependent hydrolase
MSFDRLLVSRPSPRPAAPAAAARWTIHGWVLDAAGLRDATIVIDGDRIAEVVPGRPDPAPEAMHLDVDGLVVPGFVDAHNHLPYSVFGRWRPARRLDGRFDWRGKTRCGAWVNTALDPYYREKVSPAFKELSKGEGLVELIEHGQVRGILGGATTMVVDADLDPGQPRPPLDGFVRDASDGVPGLWGVLDVACVTDKAMARLLADLDHRRATLLVHVGEGLDPYSRGEFRTLVERKLLTRDTALIHALALGVSEWRQVREAGAAVIWSPASNVSLYDRTLDVGLIRGLGIDVALAPDWTVTGSSTILDEVRFVRTRFPQVGEQDLLEMVTSVPARLLRLDAGAIQPGRLADLVVLQTGVVGDHAGALRAFASASVSDVALVVAGGFAAYGTERYMSPLGAQPGPAPESLAFDAEDTRVERLIRFRSSRGKTFSALRDGLRDALLARGLEIAPLWEPP